MKLNLKKNQKGFTLIELLVVVAIIAILALILLLALNPVEMARRSRDARRLSDLGTVRRSIDLTLADGKTSLPASYDSDVDSTTLVTNIGGLDISKYISVIPNDPAYVAGAAASETVQVITAACGTSTAQKNAIRYHFKTDATGSVYVLRAQLESTDNCQVIAGDGNNDGYYQIGTDPGLNL